MLTPKQIDDGVRLIAPLMGFAPRPGRSSHWRVPEGMDIHYKAFHLASNMMRYHQSWDWLMPVAKRCVEESIALSKGKRPYEDRINRHHRQDVLDAISYFKIEETWMAVLEFIKYRNSLPGSVDTSTPPVAKEATEKTSYSGLCQIGVCPNEAQYTAISSDPDLNGKKVCEDHMRLTKIVK